MHQIHILPTPYSSIREVWCSARFCTREIWQLARIYILYQLIEFIAIVWYANTITRAF